MTIGVPLKEIPQPLLDEIGAALQHYFVPILGLASEYMRTTPTLLN